MTVKLTHAEVESDWYGLYRDGWTGILTPEAFSHPAKIAFGLASHIYDHAKAEGWLRAGDVCVDPFGGIGGCAFQALRHGLTWVGCELEPRWVALAEQNIALWNRKYGRLKGWGQARIIHGDSRRLAEVLKPESWNRRAGDFSVGLISSPPYVAVVSGGGKGIDFSKTKRDGDTSHQNHIHSQGTGQFTYGTSPGQLGSESGDIFWGASRMILEQVHAVLRPVGHAIWVLKAFVQKGKIVDFPDQWQALCESVGFRTVHVHRAWVVEEHGVQLATDGNHKTHRTERKSFFRRLVEAKGSPRIDFEVVLCTEADNA